VGEVAASEDECRGCVMESAADSGAAEDAGKSATSAAGCDGRLSISTDDGFGREFENVICSGLGDGGKVIAVVLLMQPLTSKKWARLLSVHLSCDGGSSRRCDRMA